jgi:uncharacterized protein
MQSYDYAHRNGVVPISWEDFAAMTRTLSERLAAEKIELIVGIARAGLFPATAVSCALRRELFPVRLTRRENDRVVYAAPVWRTPVPKVVAGKAVALIDEIADTGETLRLAADELQRHGAQRVVTAALVAHSWASPPPQVVAMTSDALVLFPWDREVYSDGQWRPHPELEEALAAQVAAPSREDD